jgi:hypothetical protein
VSYFTSFVRDGLSCWKSRLKGTGCKKNDDVLFVLFRLLPGTFSLTNVKLEAAIFQLCKRLPQPHTERQFSCNASESFKDSNKFTNHILKAIGHYYEI